LSAAASATPVVSDPPAAERGDVALRIHALEAGDNHDRSRVEIGAHALLVYLQDARLGSGWDGRS